LVKLALKMDALGHPLRLRFVVLLYRGGPMYLSELAKRAGVSRALAKVHLIKLQKAGIVKSTVALVPDEAKALRYYELVDFDIRVSPAVISGYLGEDGGGRGE
jgi:ArsR family transcriptional regulator